MCKLNSLTTTTLLPSQVGKNFWSQQVGEKSIFPVVKNETFSFAKCKDYRKIAKSQIVFFLELLEVSNHTALRLFATVTVVADGDTVKVPLKRRNLNEVLTHFLEIHKVAVIWRWCNENKLLITRRSFWFDSPKNAPDLKLIEGTLPGISCFDTSATEDWQPKINFSSKLNRVYIQCIKEIIEITAPDWQY